MTFQAFYDLYEPYKNKKEKTSLFHYYLSVNVFSTKVLMEDTIFTSPTGDGTAILRGHPSHARSTRLQGKGSTLISQLY